MAMCEKMTVLQKNYTYDCMMRRNKYMVNSSDYVIAVWNGPAERNGEYDTICGKRE